ncbi:MAG: dihydrofolate reductase [bacterium]|nr:dihydrofolate reductase [bacterium]MDZ4284537.1 dihydrofolate reductase [Patescibacteria group bacterium]
MGEEQQRQTLNIIAAVARNGVLGKRGGLPWYLPEDLKMFRKRTMGSPVIMGRRTFDSLMAMRGKPLDGRTNIVVTRQRKFSVPEGVFVVRSLDEAFKIAAEQPSVHDDVFVAGGGEIYALALPLAERFYLTEVDADPDGEVYFPLWQRFVPQCTHPEWKCIATEKWRRDEASDTRFRFLTLQRKLPVTASFEQACGPCRDHPEENN